MAPQPPPPKTLPFEAPSSPHLPLHSKRSPCAVIRVPWTDLSKLGLTSTRPSWRWWWGNRRRYPPLETGNQPMCPSPESLAAAKKGQSRSMGAKAKAGLYSPLPSHPAHTDTSCLGPGDVKEGAA